jgi:hypothetical protein
MNFNVPEKTFLEISQNVWKIKRKCISLQPLSSLRMSERKKSDNCPDIEGVIADKSSLIEKHETRCSTRVIIILRFFRLRAEAQEAREYRQEKE